MKNSKHNIVVIGGGTGSFTVLSGLKNYTENITSVVAMSDSGGSSGKLRDELEVLPPGDVRQCIAALSKNEDLQQLFNFRFNTGPLEGHPVGNLIIAAAEQMTGDFRSGIALTHKMLNFIGSVEPITTDNVTLMAKDGKQTVRGEDAISSHQFKQKHPELWLEPKQVKLNPHVAKAIKKAELIIVAPGNLYCSLCPNLAVPGMGEAMKNAKAKVVYIANLVNKPGQTDGFTAEDYAAELERIAGVKFIDTILYNTKQPTKEQLEMYAKQGELPVGIRDDGSYDVIKGNLLARQIWSNPNSSDPLASARSFIRHSPDRLAREIMKIFFA